MKYYYHKNGKNVGPMTLEALQELAEQGVILQQTPVIRVGQKEWTKWGKFKESLVEKPAPTPAPAPQQPAPAPAPQQPAPAPAPQQPAPAPAPQQPTPAPAPQQPTPAPAPQQPTPAPAPQQPAPAPASPKPTTDAPSIREQLGKFTDRVTLAYSAIDRLCDKICFLPGGIVDTPENYKKNLGFLGAIAGVSIMLAAICLCLANGLYKNIGVLAGVLLAGAIVQYICYNMYNAMTPLLFKNKIRLSSLWLPRTLALGCSLYILISISALLDCKAPGDILVQLWMILYLAATGYGCINCTKLAVDLSPESVVPGRELINLIRFIIRIGFSILHVLAPVFMFLGAISLLFDGQEFMSDIGSKLKFEHLFFLLSSHSIENTLMLILLPVISLPLYYLLSFIPDFLESFFVKGSDSRN